MIRIDLAIVLVFNILSKICLGLFLWRLFALNQLLIVAFVCLFVSSSILISVLWYIKRFRQDNVKTSSLISVCCLTVPFYGQSQDYFNEIIQIWQYFVDLPLSIISSYVFIQIGTFNMTTKNTDDFYLMLFFGIYFSLSGTMTNVIIEHASNNNSNLMGSLFSFIFRYFLFISRSLTILMVYSALDSLTGRLLAISCLFILFLILLIIYIYELIKKFDPRNDKSGKFTSFLGALYHSWKMVIDFDEAFLRNLSTKKLNICIYVSYTNAKMFAFSTYVILSHIICAYFWFYQSLVNSSVIFSLLNDFSYEQNKIRFKQIILVMICGGTLLALLSFHIYYNYYFVVNIVNTNKSGLTSKASSHNQKGRRSHDFLISANRQIAYDYDTHGYFSDTNSTSFTSSKCTTCQIDSTTTQSDYSAIKKPCDYDTSSGIISTITSCTYDRHFIDELSQFTNVNLNLHNQNQTQIQTNFYDRVYSWFAKNGNFSTPSLNTKSSNLTLVI